MSGDDSKFSDGFVTVQDFLETDLPPHSKITGPLSAGELVIIASPTGVGKTWMALGLTHSLLCCEPFLCFDPIGPAKVLHIDGEMHAAKLQSRLKRFNWDDQIIESKTLACQWTFRQAGLDRLNLAHPEDQQKLLGAAEHYDVIVLDNVYSLLQVEGESMSSDKFWTVVMELNLALRDMNKLVVWFDHTNSAGQVFGTKTKEWQVDWVGQISRSGKLEKKKLQFDFEWTKHREMDFADYPKCIRVNMSTDNPDGLCEWSFETIVASDERIERALEMMESGDTYGTICGELKCSRQWLSKIKKEYGIK